MSRAAIVKTSLAFAFGLGIALSAGAQADIQCSSNSKRFAVPSLCPGNCPRTMAAHGVCGLVPQCTGLKSDPKLIDFYNQGVPALERPSQLFSNAVGKGQIHLVEEIIDGLYKPFTRSDVQIKYGSPPHGGWCELDRDVAPGQKPDLWVTKDVFNQSPGFLVSCIGHELIHLEQIRRPKKVDFVGINEAVNAFRELEAWSWETGDAKFKWMIGPSRVDDCITPDEMKEQVFGLQCAQWQVRRAIEELNQGHRFLPALEKWLDNDPWASSQWLPLPSNKDWKSFTAGAQPQGCPDPTK